MTTRADAVARLEAAVLEVSGAGLVPGGVSRGFRLSAQLAYPRLAEALAWRYDGNNEVAGLSVLAPATGHVFRLACFSATAAGADLLADAVWRALRRAGFPTILYEGEGQVGELVYQRLGAVSH